MKGEAISHSRLREVLAYDEDSGAFTWLVTPCNSVRIGQSAGWKHSAGYVAITVDGRRYFAHRLAWFFVHGYWPKDQIDHINGERADNRIANLREATYAENRQNQHIPHSNNKTGLLGVSWLESKGYFIACIRYNGKQKYLGQFGTAEEAHAAYLKAKAELHPFSRSTLGAAA